MDDWLELDVGLLVLGVLVLCGLAYMTTKRNLPLASAAFGLEAPEGSSTSSASSFFSFLGPPPNIENTLSLTAEAAVDAALVTVSAAEAAGFSSAGLGASVTSEVTFAVSSLERVAPGAAVCSAEGSGLAVSDIVVEDNDRYIGLWVCVN